MDPELTDELKPQRRTWIIAGIIAVLAVAVGVVVYGITSQPGTSQSVEPASQNAAVTDSSTTATNTPANSASPSPSTSATTKSPSSSVSASLSSTPSAAKTLATPVASSSKPVSGSQATPSTSKPNQIRQPQAYTRQAAINYVSGLGYTPVQVDYVDGRVLNVIIGSRQSSRPGSIAFFFANGYSAGNDTATPSTAVTVSAVSGTVITLRYALFSSKSPTKSIKRAKVHFSWDGTKIHALDPIPPSYDEAQTIGATYYR